MNEELSNNIKLESVSETTDPKEERSGILRFLLDVLETIVLSALLFAAINAISARIRVDGFSMEPTLLNGEFVIVNKLSYKLGDPQYSDVIVFHFPRDPEQEYIKRIIGLPGDLVRIADGQVFVNKKKINEPYITAPPKYQSEWKVAEGSLFVLGDNRNRSSDSHNWGTVPLDYVVGKALFIYWPPQAWGSIEQPQAASAAP